MPTIRPVDPAVLKQQMEAAGAAPDPLAGPPPSQAAAGTQAKRVAVPDLPTVKAAFAEGQGGEYVVTVPLPNGGSAKMKAPNVALQLFVGQVMGAEFSPYLWNLAKAVMYVTEVNGQHQDRPVNKVELQKLMNKLGDNGVELVMAAYRDFFGVLVEADQLPLSGQQ